MDYTLFRCYDDPDTGRHGGFGIGRSGYVTFDGDVDFRIYLAM